MKNSELKAKNSLNFEDLDKILFFRILVARLGESPRFAWWDKKLDATDFDGGGAFFQKLLPDENPNLGLLSAVEAPIESAKALELLRSNQANNQDIKLSIFLCPPEMESDLNDRIFHWKRFPGEIPENIQRILDSKTGQDLLVDELKNLTKEIVKPKTEGTTIGKKVLKHLSNDQISIDDFNALLSLIELKKEDWTFPYYG
jgi:hypothetical protein